MTIDQTRLAQITTLSHGAHEPDGAQLCAMEAVAFIAREPWSDHPQCACPVIGAFMRSWNDCLPDADRTALLLPLIPRLVGTRGSKALEARRANMAVDWMVRVHAPAWLRLAGLTDHADALSSMPEITDFSNTPALKPALEAARKNARAARDAAWAAARDAAGAAAGDAARDAAWVAVAAGAAARDAAWVAAWVAARVAVAAGAVAWTAWVAAWVAARDAAWGAAGDAAWVALAPTVKALQQSAVALVERMIEAHD